MGNRWPIRSASLNLVLGLGLFLAFWAVGCGSTFKVAGRSMEPTLKEGTVVTTAPATDLKRGDIVVFEFPQDRNQLRLSRIIGLPGETLEVKGGQVFSNSNPLQEPYINEPPNYTMPPTVIGTDQFFVLGDNRNFSNDSHQWGTVPRSHIRGVVQLSR